MGLQFLQSRRCCIPWGLARGLHERRIDPARPHIAGMLACVSSWMCLSLHCVERLHAVNRRHADPRKASRLPLPHTISLSRGQQIPMMRACRGFLDEGHQVSCRGGVDVWCDLLWRRWHLGFSRVDLASISHSGCWDAVGMLSGRGVRRWEGMAPVRGRLLRVHACIHNGQTEAGVD